MIDTSGLEGWMNPDPITADAGKLRTSGATYSERMQDTGRAWTPIGNAYTLGVGRDDLLTALVNPQIHAHGVETLTDLAAKELERLADMIRGYESDRQFLLGKVSTLRREKAAHDASGEDGFLAPDFDRMASDLQTQVDILANAYLTEIEKISQNISGLTMDAPHVRDAAASGDFLDSITAPEGAWVTPTMSAILKFIRPEIVDGKPVFKDGDKWKLPANAPDWMKKLTKSDLGKWLTKLTTPVSWGLGYADQYEDSATNLVLMNPTWSNDQIAARTIEETITQGTVRNLVGTVVSEVASRGAAAGTGAMLGASVGGPIGSGIGVVVALGAGMGASAGARHLGLGSRAARGVQGLIDKTSGGGTPYRLEEYAPVAYAYPEGKRREIPVPDKLFDECTVPEESALPPDWHPPMVTPKDDDLPPDWHPPMVTEDDDLPPWMRPTLPGGPIWEAIPRDEPTAPPKVPTPPPTFPPNSSPIPPKPLPSVDPLPAPEPENTLPKPEPSKPNPYVVKEGDYLEKIAEDYGTEWPKIYAANKDKIDNPDLIYPGDELTIPAP